MIAWLVRHYASIDPRTLGVTRIALAVLLLVDLGKRAIWLPHLYTDGGLLPRDLIAPLAPFGGWSPYFAVESTAGATALFVVSAIVYLALLAGIFTRVAQALALFSVLSLQHRAQPTASGGDIIMCLLCWWTLFLPLGRRFSVDAMLKHRRSPDDRPPTNPIVSLAVLGILLQLAAIYLFNALHKSGPTWRGGSAVHYTLWLDRVVTDFAVWYRGYLSPTGSKVLTWGTLAIEGSLPVLVLSPIGKPWTRRAAIAAMAALHGGIASTMNIGLFSAAMMVFGTLLLTREDWDALDRRRGREPAERTSFRWADLADAAKRAPLRTTLGAARECGVLAFAIVAGHQLLTHNPAVPALIRPPPSGMLGIAAAAARVGQTWGMFSPDVGLGEMTIVVDAVTVDGRHVDPYNALISRTADPALRDVPMPTGQHVYWHHYTLRLPQVGPMQKALKRWLLAHHERTGRPEDRIVRFEVIVVERMSPPPGEDATFPPVTRVLFRHPRERKRPR